MDFRSQLADQLQFIETSCEQYDKGGVRESVRIATALRVLFHQTRTSTSLVKHLNIPDLELLSTCASVPAGKEFFPAMTNIVIDPKHDRMEYVPKFKVEYERPLAFDDWWSTEIVYLSKNRGLQITRKDLVLGAANKDGGAHVDTALEPSHQSVLEGLEWSMTVNPTYAPSQQVRCKHGHLAALRQIGYEVLNSQLLLDLLP